MKSIMRYRGLLVIVLFQAVPIGTDEYGRTRLGIGAGAGQLEYVSLGCNGEVLDDGVANYRTAAGEVEHWLAPGRVRVHAAGGYQWSDSVTSHGPFGGVIFGYERQRFGVGAGIAIMPASVWFFPHPDQFEPRVDSNYDAMPSGYVRFGNRDLLHGRLDLFPIGTTGASEVVRMGVGYNQFNGRKSSMYLGFGVIAASLDENGSSGFIGEFFAPVSPSVALGVHGFVSPGKRNAQRGLTTMLRVNLN